MIAASAPGKVILFGEHFVVKGRPSLVSALCKRVHVKISKSEDDRFTLLSPRIGVSLRVTPQRAMSLGGKLAPLSALIRFFHEKFGVKPEPMRVEVESGIPVGAGLGSSAAFSAAFSLAYAAWHGIDVDLDTVMSASLEAERVAHGKPSGVDSAIAVYGGSLLYRVGNRPERVDIRIPEGYKLVVANTGVERSTREVVERVLGRASLLGRASSYVYDAAEELVKLALEAFKGGDALLLGELMDFNQGLLNAMGASSLIIERIVFAARSAGAVGAKLTGAGWGGSVIILVPEAEAGRVMAEVSRSGAVEVFEANIGCEGVQLER
ncbi:MAG: mevalonate kinase [Desulfurococcales archaeon]|nr:mevalonate kinase [Desulfurococcales archaeon]